jgi:hypothetical protein
MFVVCQFGLADFRGTPGFPLPWRWPTWSSSGEGQFLRSLGPLRSRRALQAEQNRRRAVQGGAAPAGRRPGADYYFIPEAFFVDAHARLGMPQQALGAGEAQACSRFTRLFRSGECLRLQIGLDLRLAAGQAADRAAFFGLLDALGAATVRRRLVTARHPKHPKKPLRFEVVERKLAQVATEFPKLYVASTTRKAAADAKPNYVARLDPILLFLFDTPALPAWCAEHRIAEAGPANPFEIAAFDHPFGAAGGAPAHVLLVSRPPGADAALRRRVQGQLLHIPADLQSFWLLLERAQRHGRLQDLDPARIEALRAEARRRAESIGDRSHSLLQDAFAGADAAIRAATPHLIDERRAEINQLLDGLSVTTLFRANAPVLQSMFGGATIGQVVVADHVEQVQKKFVATSEHGRAVATESYTEKNDRTRTNPP